MNLLFVLLELLCQVKRVRRLGNVATLTDGRSMDCMNYVFDSTLGNKYADYSLEMPPKDDFNRFCTANDGLWKMAA